MSSAPDGRTREQLDADKQYFQGLIKDSQARQAVLDARGAEMREMMPAFKAAMAERHQQAAKTAGEGERSMPESLATATVDQ